MPEVLKSAQKHGLSNLRDVMSRTPSSKSKEFINPNSINRWNYNRGGILLHALILGLQGDYHFESKMEMLLRDYDQMTSQELWRRFNIQPFNVKKIVDGQGDELMCSAIEGLQFSGFDTTDIPRFFRNVAVGQITDTFAEMGLFSPEASEPLPSDTFDQLDLALLKAGRSIPAEKQNMLQMAPLVDASLWLRDWQGGQWDVNHRSIKGKCDMTNFELLSAATARAVADQIGGNSDIFDITDNYGDIDDYMLFGLNSGGSCVYLPMVPPVRTKSTIAGLGVSWRRFQYPDRKDQPEFSMIVKGTWGESSFPPVSYFLQ